MSHNTDPERAARRHPAAILGILVALAIAAVALFWWMGADPVEHEDVSRIESSETPEGGANPEPPGPAPAGSPAAGSPPEN
ncbi:hypothetical protein [Paracoccus ravus]|uniref:hypothetical protein n=1 Tax=Paracoccus ravus TaxID=2447760 RepID=UPI00106E7CD8|nr:hypothetical protein [Paracoccus ravus]